MNTKKPIPYEFKYRTAYVETMKAYSDCHETGFSKFERNLNYCLMVEPVNGSTWADIMTRACPDGYNSFGQTVAAHVVEFFGNDSEYYLARESSVCVYIKPRHNIMLSRIPTEILADEIQVMTNGLIRLWWD